jgi:hypothetical protein
MSLFLSQKELDLFKSINLELINKVINQSVIIHTINNDLTVSDDIYNESNSKVYNIGVSVNCLIEFDNINPDSSVIGTFGSSQTMTLYMLKDSLTDNQIFFEIGDIVFWDSKYYEITFIDSQKRIEGIQQHRWDIKVSCKMTDLNSISIQ